MYQVRQVGLGLGLEHDSKGEIVIAEIIPGFPKKKKFFPKKRFPRNWFSKAHNRIWRLLQQGGR